MPDNKGNKHTSHAPMPALVSSLAGQKLLVVGDLMLDENIWGDVSRISPEAPVPVVEVRRRDYTPGGAANVAANVTALGGRAWVAGLVGDDETGRLLLRLMEQHGADVSGVMIDDGRPTTVKTRVIAQHQQLLRTDHESRAPLDRRVAQKLLALAVPAARAAGAVIASDYGKGVLAGDVVASLLKVCAPAAIPLAVDPKGRDYGRYRGASIITPNQLEAAQASSCPIADQQTLLQAGRALLEQLQCDALLITRGEHGMSLFERAGRITHLPTFARSVFDVTGAGDTVIGTLGLALAAGASYVEACTLANHAAGVAVQKIGTATVTPQELILALRPNSNSRR